MGHTSNFFLRNIHSLEDFVDKVSEVLACPITLEDTNHRLLAYSKHGENTDAARISTIISRKVPEKVIHVLWKKNIIPTLLKSDKPLRIDEIQEVGLGNRIAISIRHHEEILGFIWVLDENKKVDNKGLQFLVEASKVAKKLLLEREININNDKKDEQEIFRMLLTGVFSDEQMAKKQLTRMGLTVPNSFSILVLRMEDYITDRLQKQLLYILERIEKPSIILQIIENHDFIMFISPKTTDPLNEWKEFITTLAKEMKEKFKVKQIHVGISNIHHNLQLVPKCYEEALTVIDLKEIFPNELSHIYSYSELGLYKYLKNLVPHYEWLPALKRLSDYDQKNNSELLLTLESFLDCDLNVNETAKRLHIHVNTINYRLKRIGEIGNINFKNFNEMADIFIHLKLKKYLKRERHNT